MEFVPASLIIFEDKKKLRRFKNVSVLLRYLLVHLELWFPQLPFRTENDKIWHWVETLKCYFFDNFFLIETIVYKFLYSFRALKNNFFSNFLNYIFKDCKKKLGQSSFQRFHPIFLFCFFFLWSIMKGLTIKFRS